MRQAATVFSLSLLIAACSPGQGNGIRGLIFGSDRDDPVAAARAASDTPVADRIVSLDVAPTPGGVIISAVALPPTQGHWDARLVPLPSDDPAVYVMEFQLLPPLSPLPAGTQPSREVLGGTFLTRQDLGGIRTIAVQGLNNRRSVLRR